jgi:L-threonylcarbamoyladenylate synthase
VLDSGPTPLGVESTVLDVTRTPPVILRPGGVTREALELILGEVRLLSASAAEGGALVSPGLLDKHYAPHAEFVLCLALPPAQALSTLRTLAQQELDAGRRVGLLLADEDQPAFAGLDVEIYRLGAADDLETIARRLYAGLRTLDELGVEVILGCDFGSRGLGLAIRDRLRRAASRVIGQVD